MGNLTEILPSNWMDQLKKATTAPRPVEEQIVQAMAASGVQAPEDLAIDGQVHRFRTTGKDKSGWYVFYPDGVVAGAFGDWREFIEVSFCQDMGRELTAQELAENKIKRETAKAMREQQRAQEQAAAAAQAQLEWSKSVPAIEHEYLAKKGVQGHGSRIAPDGRLVVPLLSNESGELVSLQHISTNGKYFLTDARSKACHFMIGETDGGTVYIAEGFATAASVHETTNAPCVVAYSSSNIAHACEMLTKTHKKVVVVADNDAHGVGEKAAKEASEKFGVSYVMPSIQGMDANDYKQNGYDLAALLMPKVESWLVWADEFCEQPAPIKWHVKHWIQEHALMMVHGPSGCGKTFVVLDWMLRMATETPEWHGKKVKPGVVAYLAGEGHHGLRGRIKAWKQHNGPSHPTKMAISKSGCDLNTPLGYQKAVESLSAMPEPPKIIVVDTLHRFLDGDENSSQDAKTMLDACAKLMETFNCSVLLVHHTGVSGEAQHRARGSSAWKGALDLEISVVPGADNKSIQLVQRKNKDAEEAAPVFVDLQSVPLDGWFDEDGEQVSSAVIVAGDAPEEKEKVKESPNDRHLRLLKGAWIHGGKEIENQKPYVSKSAFVDYLTSVLGESEAAAKQKAKPSADKRPINSLIMGGIIEPYLHGFSLLCITNASAWMMAN